MSQKNVERMRRSLDAFNRGDKCAWSKLNDPEVRVVPSGDWPEGEITGTDAAWDFFVAVEEPWEPGRWDLSDFVDHGDQVAARMRRHLQGRASGIEVDYDYWVVFTFRDGLVFRAEWFETREKALEAAALSQ